MRRNARRSAFTMVEMLVIILILGILTVLLIANLRQFRQRSLTAKCSGNLRQIGAMANMYSADHNFTLIPWMEINGTSRKLWFHFLLPYVREGDWRVSGTLWDNTNDLRGQGVDIFKCPAQKDPFRLNYRLRYGINPAHASYINGADQSTTRLGNIVSLQSPSKALLIADSMDDEADGAPFSGTPNAARGYLINNNLSTPVSDRHQSGSNLLFVDGHVEFLPFDRIISTPGDTVAVEKEKKTRWDQRAN